MLLEVVPRTSWLAPLNTTVPLATPPLLTSWKPLENHRTKSRTVDGLGAALDHCVDRRAVDELTATAERVVWAVDTGAVHDLGPPR